MNENIECIGGVCVAWQLSADGTYLYPSEPFSVDVLVASRGYWSPVPVRPGLMDVLINILAAVVAIWRVARATLKGEAL